MIPVLRHKLPSLVRVAGAACIPVGTKQPSSSLSVALLAHLVEFECEMESNPISVDGLQ
jgi:hypothetical protein